MATSPPPPSPPVLHLPLHSSSGTNSFPVIAIAVIGILATTLLLISYYIFVIKCCLNWHRIDFLNRFFSRVREPVESPSANIVGPLDSGPTVQKGLDEAVIRSIPVIKFRKVKSERKGVVQDSQSEPNVSYECAVCLSEFEEGEKLRVIPNCCHAFHIDCIDVWLQSNANCPLCRSGISPASILYNAHMIGFPTSLQKGGSNVSCDKIDEHCHGDDNNNDNDNDYAGDDDDFVVIEIEGNNLDEPRLVTNTSSVSFCSSSKDPISGYERGQMKRAGIIDSKEFEGKKGRKRLGHVYSMGDELIDMRKNKDDEEFQIEPIRRSISMDLSNERDFCIELQECCRSKREESEGSCGGGSSCSSKVRRSIFSLGHGRSSRCSVQPVHLDP